MILEIGFRFQFKVILKSEEEAANSGTFLGQSRKRPKMLRAGLYARVSSNDQQTLSKSSLHL
jgi:hypothetical protein